MIRDELDANRKAYHVSILNFLTVDSVADLVMSSAESTIQLNLVVDNFGFHAEKAYMWTVFDQDVNINSSAGFPAKNSAEQ